MWWASVAAGLMATALPVHRAERGRTMVYVGTYTSGRSEGIYAFEFDGATGALAPRGATACKPSPSWLALSADGRHLYAANEDGNVDGTGSGAVSAFAVAPVTGALSLLNRQPSVGVWPCHLCLSPDGRHVLVANYGSGTLSVLPVLPDGRLGPASCTVQHRGTGPDARRQEGPHAHAVYFDPGRTTVMAADLGTDKVMLYRLVDGKLRPCSPPSASVAPGAGPRHIAFLPNGRVAYVLNEMGNTVTAFAWDANHSALTEVGSVGTLPAGFTGPTTTAEIEAHPSGRFVYASNRGHDSIAIFSVDGATGRLSPVGHQPTGGKTPRSFALAPGGRHLIAANQDTDTLCVFAIDPRTGLLRAIGSPVSVPAPVCVVFGRAR